MLTPMAGSSSAASGSSGQAAGSSGGAVDGGGAVVGFGSQQAAVVYPDVYLIDGRRAYAVVQQINLPISTGEILLLGLLAVWLGEGLGEGLPAWHRGT